MTDKFERLSYTKDWNKASDFPAYEENEAQVRSDMQLLHDEVKEFINEKLIPGIENMAVPGTGDMLTDMYDPTAKRQDLFSYADRLAAASVSTAKDNTNTAIEEYDVGQTLKFNAVDVRQRAVENTLAVTPGKITLLKEYKAAGTYTVELPGDTAAVYALVIGAGGGGGGGTTNATTDPNYDGGGGGAGGNAFYVGPVLPENIENFTVEVGAGGAGGDTTNQGGKGGASSAFGVSAAGGNGGGDDYDAAPGEQTESAYAFLGGSGGTGARHYRDTITDSGFIDTASTAGKVSTRHIPMILKSFSAGGGGGGTYESQVGSAGGKAFIGEGGKGGDYGKAGGNGGQCCGGGGGARGNVGGNGGDGYVAIWIQRTGGAT